MSEAFVRDPNGVEYPFDRVNSQDPFEIAQFLFRHCNMSDPIMARLFDAWVDRIRTLQEQKRAV